MVIMAGMFSGMSQGKTAMNASGNNTKPGHLDLVRALRDGYSNEAFKLTPDHP
jgi:hypothetical protein